MVGGDILIRNGMLQAPNGRIQLVSTALPGEIAYDDLLSSDTHPLIQGNIDIS